MKYILLMIKGFIVGVAKIIPGISGAVLAISLGIYERLISIIASPLKININDLKFIVSIMLGMLTSILLLSNFIKWILTLYYVWAVFLFIGLIIGSTKDITSKITLKKTNIFCILITIFISYILLINHNFNIKENNPYLIMGMLEALTTIIPGISGTAIFISLGLYTKMLELYNLLITFNINIKFIIDFIIGFILSLTLCAKTINYLFNKHQSIAYSIVLGLMITSLFVMFKSIFKYKLTLFKIIIGIILLITGYKCTKKINSFLSNYSN